MTGSDLKDKVTLQELGLDQDGNWAWMAGQTLYAKVDPDEKRNLFSSIGIGTRGVTIHLRKRPLTLHQSFLWRGRHCFLTSILPVEDSPGFLVVKAALVNPGQWLQDTDQPQPGQSFPAVLTERYVQHDVMDLHSEVHGGFVLVTPKVVELAPGSWVTSAGQTYRVEAPHLLDEFKNEYELLREEDC